MPPRASANLGKCPAGGAAAENRRLPDAIAVGLQNNPRLRAAPAAIESWLTWMKPPRRERSLSIGRLDQLSGYRAKGVCVTDAGHARLLDVLMSYFRDPERLPPPP